LQTISRRGIGLTLLRKPHAAICVQFNIMDSLFSSIFIGTAMPVHLTWPDLVVRIVCMFTAGIIIGYDRILTGVGFVAALSSASPPLPLPFARLASAAVPVFGHSL